MSSFTFVVISLKNTFNLSNNSERTEKKVHLKEVMIEKNKVEMWRNLLKRKDQLVPFSFPLIFFKCMGVVHISCQIALLCNKNRKLCSSTISREWLWFISNERRSVLLFPTLLRSWLSIRCICLTPPITDAPSCLALWKLFSFQYILNLHGLFK